MDNVLALYSSARKKGNTYKMVQVFSHLVPCRQVFIDDLTIGEYDYEYQNQADDFAFVADEMLKADTIIFACPVYWYSLTPGFKRLFDRFTDLISLPELRSKGKALRHKTFYLFSTSNHDSPPDAFVSVVRDTLEYLDWSFRGVVHLNCKDTFDKENALISLSEVFENKRERSALSTLGRQAEIMARIK